MGNRANVVFTDGKEYSPAIYLHWNGGPESIYAFLAEMDRRKIRAGDTMYESARFCHIVGDFMDHNRISGLSLGLTNGPLSDSPAAFSKVQTDSGDNGFYLVQRTSNGNGRIVTKVRRFTGFNPVKEHDQMTVERERQAAMNSYHLAAIAAVFAEITKGKEIEGD